MNIIPKLLVPCRVVIQSHYSKLHHIPKLVKPVPTIFTQSCVTTMAQRSITSFFTRTPPKPAVKQENKDKKEMKINGDSKEDLSVTKTSSKRARLESNESDGSPQKKPATPVVSSDKATSKRARLESSESDGSPQKKPATPEVNSDKKKKVKRQRIESSGSESESSPVNKETTITSPKDKKPTIKAEPESPPNKNDENVIKVEKTSSPKTYSSPKAKKKKGTLTEVNGKEKSPAVKDKKAAGKRKKESSSVKEEKNLAKEKRSPSPVKVKKEVEDDKSKKEEDNVKEEKETKSENKGLVPEAEYNPSKSKYHPITDACWSKGADVPYLALARTMELIEGTSARLKIIEILSNYLRSVIALTPQDLLPSIYMCLNQLAPAYHSVELGIAETYLMKAIGQCTGRTLAQVKAAAARAGDLGHVAEQARATQRTMFAPPKLTARKVFNALKEIAGMTGHASVNKKINKIQSLYVACRHSEARYLIRSLEGKLRIGLAEQSVLQALALATAMTPPDPDGVKVLDASKGMSPEKFKAIVDEHALTIKTTYCSCPNYDSIVSVLLREGVAALPQHCRLTPGVPLKPMLAHPTKGVSEVFDRFEKEQFTCEWKYDGERAQIHVPAADDKPDLGNASIFSRNQENNTTKYPDILRRLPSLLKESVTSCVLDCEAVAYDTDTKQILPFQILSTRKRKDAVQSEIKVQVCVFVFDLLYLNGDSLVTQPLIKRRELLREHFQEKEGEWQFATSRDCNSVEEVQQFLDESVRGSCEGLMVKALSGDNAKYDIARRSHNWLKLKKDYLDGVGDTIDVVVIGAYSGRGKRAGLFGGFLLACYEPDTEEYQSLCKIGTGFSDDDLQTLTASLKEHVIDAPRTYYRYDSQHTPDVWVSARAVWEVRCADLSLSAAHHAAIGRVSNDKGISLRFPRFIRVRDDKSPEQATSAQQIAEMYLAQDQVKNTKSNKNTNMDDFY